jgi:hypothetical protein
VTLSEIKLAVDNGNTVYWKQSNYFVFKNSRGKYFIVCENNGHMIGLTWADDVTLNGKESDFYIGE